MIVLYTKDKERIELYKHNVKALHRDGRLFTPNSIYFKGSNDKWILCSSFTLQEVINILKTNTYEKAVQLLSS